MQNLYKFIPDINRSLCLVDANCPINKKSGLKGKHAGNLMRHLASFHRVQHEAVKQESKRVDVANKRKRDDAAVKPRKKLITSFTEENLITGCVELVTANGRPFSYLNNSGFQRIISPFFQSSEQIRAISAESIRNCVPDEARSIRELLQQEFKGKVLSIKVDSAKRHGRSLLGNLSC